MFPEHTQQAFSFSVFSIRANIIWHVLEPISWKRQKKRKVFLVANASGRFTRCSPKCLLNLDARHSSLRNPSGRHLAVLLHSQKKKILKKKGKKRNAVLGFFFFLHRRAVVGMDGGSQFTECSRQPCVGGGLQGLQLQLLGWDSDRAAS